MNLLKPPTVFYLIPLVPVATRLVLFFAFWETRKEVLRPDQIARESTKSFALPMAGLSFTGVVAIAVLDSVRQSNFRIPVFYMLISFLCYLIAVNMQDYKFFVSREVLSNTLIDVATLGLICTAVLFVFSADYGQAFKIFVLVLAAIGWLTDHILRLRYTYVDLERFRRKVRNRNEQQQLREEQLRVEQLRLEQERAAHLASGLSTTGKAPTAAGS